MMNELWIYYTIYYTIASMGFVHSHFVQTKKILIDGFFLTCRFLPDGFFLVCQNKQDDLLPFRPPSVLRFFHSKYSIAHLVFSRNA